LDANSKPNKQYNTMKNIEIKGLKKGTPVVHKKKPAFFRGMNEHSTKAMISLTKTGKIVGEVTAASIQLEAVV
jgi:hypothetical protein